MQTLKLSSIDFLQLIDWMERKDWVFRSRHWKRNAWNHVIRDITKDILNVFFSCSIILKFLWVCWNTSHAFLQYVLYFPDMTYMSTFFRCPRGLGALRALCTPMPYITYVPLVLHVSLHLFRLLALPVLLAIRVLRGLVFVVLLTLMPTVFGFVWFPSGFVIFSHLINF